MDKKPFNKRRLKYGSLATVITVGFLVALVLVNVIVSLLLERFPLDIDLTQDQRFNLTEDSVNYIKDLDRDVHITVLAAESRFSAAGSQGNEIGDLYKQAYEVLQNYERHSGGHIQVEFVDPVTNPTVTQAYPNETFTAGDMIVESDLRMKKVALNSLFSYSQSQYDGSVTYRSEAEQNLTSAIMYVTDEDPITVTVLTGFDTPDISAYTDLLAANNYEVTELDLLTGEIDSNSAFLVLPQPSGDLTAEQVKKLEAYLDNNGQFGKGLVFIASQTSTVGPVLKTFLAEWGVAIGDGFLYETSDGNFLQDPFHMLNRIVDETTSEAMGNAAAAPLLAPYARPVELTFKLSASGDGTYASGNRTARIITETSDTAVMIPADYGEDFDPYAQPQQSYPTIVLTSRMKYEGMTPMTSYVLTISSPELLSSTYMTYQMFSNSSLMAALDEQLAARKAQVTILPLNISVDSIAITDAQVKTYLVVLVILIPLATLAAGVIIWLRRRHL